MLIIYGYDFYPKTYCETGSKKSGLALYNTFQVYGLKNYGLSLAFIRSYYGNDEKFSKRIIDGIEVYNMPVTFTKYFEPNGTFDPQLCYKFYHENISVTNPIYSQLYNNLKKIIDSVEDSKVVINTHNFIPTVVTSLLKQQYPKKDILIHATIHDIDNRLANFIK